MIPSHIIVHLGGSDLNNEELSEKFAEETVLKIISYCGMLKQRHSIQQVTIMQLLPRTETCHIPHNIYHNMVVHTNSFLKKKLKTIQNVKYWNINGMKNSPVNLYIAGEMVIYYKMTIKISPNTNIIQTLQSIVRNNNNVFDLINDQCKQ